MVPRGFFKSKADLEVADVDYVEPQFDFGIDPIVLVLCFDLDGYIPEWKTYSRRT